MITRWFVTEILADYTALKCKVKQYRSCNLKRNVCGVLWEDMEEGKCTELE